MGAVRGTRRAVLSIYSNDAAHELAQLPISVTH
jgi:hypothetical protein